MGLPDLGRLSVKGKKRRGSESDTSSDHEKSKKKKAKERKHSESNSDNEEIVRKSKKHRKETVDMGRKLPKSRKSSSDRNKKIHSETSDSENEAFKSKQKERNIDGKIDSGSEKELKKIKSYKRNREDKKRTKSKSHVGKESSKDKYKRYASEKEKYKNSDRSRNIFKDHDEDGNNSGRKNKYDSGNESGDDDKSERLKLKSKSHRNSRKEIYDDKTKASEASRKERKSKMDDYEESHHLRKHSSENKQRDRLKYDENLSYERNEEGSESAYGDNDRTSSNEKPFRYRSISRGPIRKNSDSYWNKYSERLKEPEETIQEHMEVGPRYYSSGNTMRNENMNKEDTSDKKKQDDVSNNEIAKPKKTFDALTSRTGGAYIPPAKLRMMQEGITDKASAVYQRLAWEALKKSIQGHVNKVNTSNITIILRAVMKENIVRGRGLLCRALIQAQAASPSFTNVYAAFVASLNAKFPKIGELLLKRLITQFRRGFKRNDKTICITAVTFIAHLVNQEMVHEILALEILTLLLETPTDDSVEVAIAFLKECGMKLTEVSNRGVMAIFDMLRNILHEGKLEQRVQYMIEVMFQIRKEDFKAHPSVVPELDLISEDDRILHTVTLEEPHDPQEILNVFKFDPDYEANEAKYKSLVEGGDEESGEEDESGSNDSDGESEEEEEEEGEQKNGTIVDRTETNLTALRKTIYLTIQSSLDFQECAHKLLRMELKPGQEIEMAHMFLDCCSEQRTYEKFFGLLSQRFCQINRAYIAPFEETFRDSYATIHRMSNDKLRNVAKLFAHLLFTDAISWEVLSTIRLNEDDTTSSSRIFIKIMFLELSEYMGLAKLNQRVKDPSLQTALEGLFPRDNPKHTRFAINFFTSIGLGGLTDELREHLKAQPKPSIAVPQLVEGLSSSTSSSSDSSDSSSESSSSDSSSSDSSSSDSEDERNKRKKKKQTDKKKNVSAKKSGKEEKRSKKTVNKDSSSRKKKKSSPPRRRDR